MFLGKHKHRTITDSQGQYTIPKTTKLPATLNVGYIGYSLKKKEIVNNEYIFTYNHQLTLMKLM